MENTLKYVRIRKVKPLNRAHPTDAGIDFYVPEDLTAQQMKQKLSVTGDNVAVQYNGKFISKILLKPGHSILIPSGIHLKIPAGHALIYFNKSGVASKKHLHVGACVVDESYQGECHLNITNVGDTPQEICAGEKLVQGIVVPINYCVAEEMTSLAELYPEKSDRGAGGFGSTNEKK